MATPRLGLVVEDNLLNFHVYMYMYMHPDPVHVHCTCTCATCIICVLYDVVA